MITFCTLLFLAKEHTGGVKVILPNKKRLNISFIVQANELIFLSVIETQLSSILIKTCLKKLFVKYSLDCKEGHMRKIFCLSVCVFAQDQRSKVKLKIYPPPHRLILEISSVSMTDVGSWPKPWME